MHEGSKILTLPVSIVTESELMNTFSDFSDTRLQKLFTALNKQIQKQTKTIEISDWSSSQLLAYQRKWGELNYTKNIVENIITKRSQKYLVPVAWYTIGDNHPSNRVPNALRPYRAAYTDGIHHGWDVGSELWEEVISIDDGVVVRVVADFDWSDFDRIIYREDASYEEQVKNLDVLRWKQVWAKTSRGDIVLYSHLDDIYSHIVEGSVIRKWQPLGTIGITGVPDKNYTDYHLHFAIHKNPYNDSMVGKYTIDDYLYWDWYYKWASQEVVYRGQSELFE